MFNTGVYDVCPWVIFGTWFYKPWDIHINITQLFWNAYTSWCYYLCCGYMFPHFLCIKLIYTTLKMGYYLRPLLLLSGWLLAIYRDIFNFYRSGYLSIGLDIYVCRWGYLSIKMPLYKRQWISSWIIHCCVYHVWHTEFSEPDINKLYI